MTGGKGDVKGQSRGAARRRALLEAAWSLVRENGLSAVTLDNIIARAGGSKATIYAGFGDKDGLIEAAISEHCATFADQMMEMLDADSDPAVTLTRLASGLVEQIWTPEAVRIFGSFLTEGTRYPQVMEAFQRNGPARLHRRLSRYLTGVQREGHPAIANPDQAAKMFIDALHGDWLLNSLGKSAGRRLDDPDTVSWIRYVVARTLDRPVEEVDCPLPVAGVSAPG